MDVKEPDLGYISTNCIPNWIYINGISTFFRGIFKVSNPNLTLFILEKHL